MEVGDIPQIAPNVDYNSIQPLNQKRTIAFVNHFLLSTVSFLNDFASSCESCLIQFEYKLQKIEASLLILESQLSSIPDLNDVNVNPIEVAVELPEVAATEMPLLETDSQQTGCVNDNKQNSTVEEDHEETTNNGIKASADPRYCRFFKMLQFGVPPAAVRLKMEVEGVDPHILDNPNAVIPGQAEQSQ